MAAQGLPTRKVSAPPPPVMTLSLWVFHVSVGDRQSRQSFPTPDSSPPTPSSSAQQGLGGGNCPRQPLVSSSVMRDATA